MLRDNKLRPLNPDPCLPVLSEGVANRSDLPTWGLHQLVKELTRMQDDTQNNFDLVLTTHPNLVTHCKVVAGISDHEAISFAIK